MPVAMGIAARQSPVLTCSALRRVYRDLLRRSEVRFVCLRADRDLVARRVAARQGHFFAPALRDSQSQAREEVAPNEGAVTVLLDRSLLEVVGVILAATG